MISHINDDTLKLFRAILAIENEEECAAFFEDICTIKEIQDLTQRLAAAAIGAC